MLAATACDKPVDPTWHQETGHRWRELESPKRGKPGFTLMDPSATGVSFTNTVSDSLLVKNRILAHGAGVCLGDVDGDERPDVYLARTQGSNALYRNLGGHKFEDITARAGVAAADRFSSGCVIADVNGDGSRDLIVSAIGGTNALYVNDGKGNFTEQGAEAGLASNAGSTTLAMADVNGDGALDLYVANYRARTTLDEISPQERSFDQVVRQTGPDKFELKEKYRNDYRVVDRPDLGGVSLEQRADPDFFYLGDGKGRFLRERIAGNPRFRDRDGASLKSDPEDFSLAAIFADLDGDRAPDLYVANDFEDPDLVWKNDGRGNFRQMPATAVRSTSNSGMAVDVADINRDGHPDLFQVDMLAMDSKRLKMQIPTHTSLPKLPGAGETTSQMQRNTLQLNRGDGTFAETAQLARVAASGWSWSTLFMDVDLDGWEDILVGTGHKWDVMDGDTQYRLRNRLQEIDWRKMLFEYPPLPLPNVAFRNKGDLTFDDASAAWRFDIGADVSHGMAVADLDGDGDMDVVINRLDKPAAILRNDATAGRVAVRLRGAAPNTAGIGSLVRVKGGAVASQQREMIAGGLYLSSSDAELSFATGKAQSVTIEVEWRDGRRSVIENAKPGRLYEIEPANAGAVALQSVPRDAAPRDTVARALFEDVTTQLGGHRHVDAYFDDFSRQMLLPSTLTQLGPGIAWADLDGNGSEELIVGAGRTGTLAVFRNSGGRLTRSTTQFSATPVDLTTVLALPDGSGGQEIVAGASSYELEPAQMGSLPSAVAYSPTSGLALNLVPPGVGATGPLAAADYDGDGTLDLFVGARVIPQRYPLQPSSRLFRNAAGLALDSENSKAFQDVGMVSSAVFSDINGDGWPDLVLALEWGEVKLFVNNRGRFSASHMAGLAGVTSRWNGVATGDIDGDGRMDIVATSWGRNGALRASQENPLLMYQVLTRRGPDVLMAQHDPRTNKVAPLESYARVGLAAPTMPMRIRSFAQFADASMNDVVGNQPASTRPYTASTLDHTLFLNRGDRFQARALPVEAQMAAAFHAGIADYDGDGTEDLFLSENFFGTNVATPRYDAGRSLLLVGKAGSGGALDPLPGARSGLVIYGEQRGAAHADFDGDGRLDLAVSQNSGSTRLYRNVGALPGLRVRLVGPVANPTGVGAQMRLKYAAGDGPVREIQAGAGYWSQNGAVQVLGRAGAPTALWVRWPGGREQTVPLTSGQREITVRATQ